MKGGEGCQWRAESGAGISGELGPFLLVERMNVLFYHSPDFSSRDIAHSLVPAVRKMENVRKHRFGIASVIPSRSRGGLKGWVIM